MALGEIASSILEVVFRFLAEIFFQIVVEILIKGPGYFLTRMLSLRKGQNIDPDGAVVLMIGVVFWVSIGLATYFFFFNNK